MSYSDLLSLHGGDQQDERRVMLPANSLAAAIVLLLL